MAFKRILCAVDFSEASLAAFRKAAEMARFGASRLYVLHSIEARPVVSSLPGIDEAGAMAVEFEEKATAALESLIASSASVLKGIQLTTEVTAGRASVEILNHAHDWQADLIVIGATGAASLEQIVVGNTAERVMKDAPCSVLIVRQDTAQRVVQGMAPAARLLKQAAASQFYERNRASFRRKGSGYANRNTRN